MNHKETNQESRVNITEILPIVQEKFVQIHFQSLKASEGFYLLVPEQKKKNGEDYIQVTWKKNHCYCIWLQQ